MLSLNGVLFGDSAGPGFFPKCGPWVRRMDNACLAAVPRIRQRRSRPQMYRWNDEIGQLPLERGDRESEEDIDILRRLSQSCAGLTDVRIG